MKTYSRKRHTLVAVMVSIAMIFSVTPAAGLAANTAEAGEPEMEIKSPVKAAAVNTNAKLASNEALLGQYLENEATGSVPVIGSRGNKLGDANKAIYDYVLKEIKKIAAGKEDSTQIVIPASVFLKDTTVTAEEAGVSGFFKTDENGDYDLDDNGNLQWADDVSSKLTKAVLDKNSVDIDKVISALLYDMPYEMYWFDKTESPQTQTIFPYIDLCLDEDNNLRNDQVVVTVSGEENEEVKSSYMLFLSVSDDYSYKYDKVYKNGYLDSYKMEFYRTDKEITSAVGTTVDNAKSIVNAAAGKSDENKLKAYKDKICEDVSYNSKAAEAEPVPPYGNPWQIIYVFDDDPDTNVVCEGYSKAFKYLCDITEFNDDHIECSLMTGHMTGGTGAGGHMWNVVRMDNGENYLVDVTNCDEGTIGYSDKLFLVTDGKQDSSGYSIELSDTITYVYDKETLAAFDAKERTLAAKKYESHVHNLKSVSANNATCTEAGNIAYWRCEYCGELFSDESGKHGITEEDIVVKAGHKLEKTEAKAATCTDAGNLEYWTCTECGKIFSDANGKNEITKASTIVKETGHNWDEGTVSREATVMMEGEKTFKCLNPNCNATRTEAIAKLQVNENGVAQEDCIDSTTPTETAANEAQQVSTIGKIASSKIGTVGNIKKKTMTISWKKVSGAINYRVAYRKAGAVNWNYVWTGNSTKTKYVIKSLKTNQMVEFKVAAYGAKDGKWVYGGWSGTSYRYMAATTVKLKAGKKSFKATIKKVKKSSGYDVVYALNKAQTKSKKTKALKGASKTKLVVKKLKKGKKYYVKVRPYKKYKGKKYIGILSKAYTVKVK